MGKWFQDGFICCSALVNAHTGKGIDYVHKQHTAIAHHINP
jgi:hypothetical protein